MATVRRNLRSAGVLDGEHPLTAPGTEVHEIPLLAVPVTGPDSDWTSIPNLATPYCGFVADGAEQIVQALGIAARAHGPVLIHCAAALDTYLRRVVG